MKNICKKMNKDTESNGRNYAFGVFGTPLLQSCAVF